MLSVNLSVFLCMLNCVSSVHTNVCVRLAAHIESKGVLKGRADVVSSVCRMEDRRVLCVIHVMVVCRPVHPGHW